MWFVGLYKTNISRYWKKTCFLESSVFLFVLLPWISVTSKLMNIFFINFRCLKFRGIQIVHRHTRGRGGGQLNAYVPYRNEQFSYMKCVQGERGWGWGGGGGGIFDILRTYYLNGSFWIFTFSQKSPLYSIFLSIGKAH